VIETYSRIERFLGPEKRVIAKEPKNSRQSIYNTSYRKTKLGDFQLNKENSSNFSEKGF